MYQYRSFKSVRWGKLRTIALPSTLYPDGVLTLSDAALQVFVALVHAQKAMRKSDRTAFHNATVPIRQGPVTINKPMGTSLTERTGLSRRSVSRGIQELISAGFIATIRNTEREERSKKGTLLCQEYVLLSKKSGMPLKTGEPNALYSNRLPYFTFPSDLVVETGKRWSLASMSSSEARVYTTALWIASKHRNNQFETKVSALQRHADVSPQTLVKALDGLESRGLLWISGVGRSQKDKIQVEVCDPLTGTPLPIVDGDNEDNPQNYTARESSTQTRRLDMNIDLNDPHAVEEFLTHRLGYRGQVVQQGNGDLKICCPFHDDQTASLSISPTKQGCWHCFGCNKRGNIFDIVRAFSKVAWSRIEVQHPDSKAEAIYTYKDRWSRLIKQVLRYPNKDFRQRQPDKGGWNWNVSDVGPLIYNADLLQYADTVCITEGEKDADKVTALKLTGLCTPVVAVTSGGADSWDPSLAKQLQGKRVILVPDDDEAGNRYADAVEQSLKLEGIEYRRVSFVGTGSKDASDYLDSHSPEDFVRLFVPDWVRMPDGAWLVEEESAPGALLAGGSCEGAEYGDITM